MTLVKIKDYLCVRKGLRSCNLSVFSDVLGNEELLHLDCGFLLKLLGLRRSTSEQILIRHVPDWK